MKKVKESVRNVFISGATAIDSWRLMSDPIMKAPIIPKIEPTAAPINVFKEARRMRTSKKMIATAMKAATRAEMILEAKGSETSPVETSHSPDTGCNT
jgi:hypothetical protein